MRNKIIGCFLSCITIAVISCNSLNSTITKSEVYRQNHTGFYLFDPETKKVLADVNGEKYFTPASNTKIFTFYTGLNVLGDSLPGLKYISRNDSLIIWGTGDPSFLHPDLPQSVIHEFLNSRKEKIYFSLENYYDDAFGPGWAWDDYPYYYQPEKASFPIHGNVVHFEKDSGSTQIKIEPDFFRKFLYPDNGTNRYGTIQRDPANNLFYKKDLHDSIEVDRYFPYKYSSLIVKELLEDTLKRDIGIVSEPLDPLAQTVYSIPSDTLYKMMMEVSDNFFAEQVLLMSAGVLTDSLNTEIAINYSKKFLLSDLPDEPIWRDGSGLSRYNLFTPRSIVKLWGKIYDLVPEERLFNMIANGGVSGTIENWYKAEEPYIFGKTGTLSNNHALPGFIKTKKGKILIFSFMHNNYTTSSSAIKREMQTILRGIYEKY